MAALLQSALDATNELRQDYVHSKNLLFGLYSDAGTHTCAGRPGSLTFEKIDAQTYAECVQHSTFHALTLARMSHVAGGVSTI